MNAIIVSSHLDLRSFTLQKIPKKRSRTDVEHVLLQTVQENGDDDEFTTFGKTVADTIRKLPRISQICVKKNINDMLFEAEIQAIRNECEDEPISRIGSLDN